MLDNDYGLEKAMFEEPADFLPPPPESHFVKYERKVLNCTPQTISLKLVGKSPLWGHLLWNAGIYTADYLDKHAKELVRGKRILELGAASGLPSLICAINGASLVVSTDYPDPDLISHIEYNFEALKGAGHIGTNYKVQGYIWGNDVGPLFYANDDGQLEKFDMVILSDLVFNHSEHHKLLETCRATVKNNGRCLVVFLPHRAHLLDVDLAFFETCKEYDFVAQQIDVVQWTPMFDEDKSTHSIRSRIYAYNLIPQW